MIKMPVFPLMHPAQCFKENLKGIFLKNVITLVFSNLLRRLQERRYHYSPFSHKEKTLKNVSYLKIKIDLHVLKFSARLDEMSAKKTFIPLFHEKC